MRRVSRRDFLATSSVALGALPLIRTTAFAQTADAVFRHGVASGDPLADRVILWTRVTPKAPAGSASVRWQVARDPKFAQIVTRGETATGAERDFTVKVDASGLQPGSTYYYRFEALGARSAVGRTRTLPREGVGRLRLGVVSCSNLPQGYFNAYACLAKRADLDAVLHLGDYIYESSVRRGHVRRHNQTAEPVALSDYRIRHALYKTDADLQAAHRMLPWIATWDDHEVDNDYANDRQEEGRTPAHEFLSRRAAAYQAYYEHMPLPAAMRPRGPEMRIHTGLAWGSLASFHVLDARQYRSHQACPNATGRASEVEPGHCIELRDPSRSLLGKQQEGWLDERFANSRSAWNIVAQPLLMAQRDNKPGEGRLFWSDGWDGYAAARRRLLESVVARRVSNPVVIGGDVHMHFVADLKLDFDDEKSPVVASEFTGTSISSNAGPWQRNWKTILAENPHLKYLRGDQRGYVRASVSAGRIIAELVGVETVKLPDSGAKVLARFAVEDGKPGPRRQ